MIEENFKQNTKQHLTYLLQFIGTTLGSSSWVQCVWNLSKNSLVYLKFFLSVIFYVIDRLWISRDYTFDFQFLLI